MLLGLLVLRLPVPGDLERLVLSLVRFAACCCGACCGGGVGRAAASASLAA